MLALLGNAACSRGDNVTTAHAEGESARTSLRPTSDVSLPPITAGGAAYVERAVTDGGTVTGTVDLDGAPPADSTVTPPPELQRECGATLPIPTVELQKGSTRLGGVVVWLEGVRSGKALPDLRRHEVSIDECRLTPRAQALQTGGTLHVHSESAMHALVRMTRWPAGELAATVTTNDDGEVVPNDKVLSKVGTLEVRGAQPTWLRAWVLVFDHPYATTTPAAGTFSLDSVPPGQYTLVAWHERFGHVSQPVTVSAGQTTTVALRFSSTSAPAAPAAPADTTRRAPDTAAARR